MAVETILFTLLLLFITKTKTHNTIIEFTYGATIHPLFTEERNDATYVPIGMDTDILMEIGFGMDNSTHQFKFKHKYVGNKNYDIDPWKKLMTSLSKREVEMIMPFGYLTPQVIAGDYDISVAVYSVVYGAVVRKISIEDSFKQYIQPFDWLVWTTIGSSTVFFGIILALTYYCSPYSGYNKKVKNGEEPMQSFGITYSIYATVCALFQQDQDRSPQYSSGKVIFITYVACTYVILQGYSAVLTSFLATGSDKLPFDDVKSLSLNQHYTVGTDDTFDIIEMFKSSPDSNMKNIAQRILTNSSNNLISNPEFAIKRVLNEKFVYITEMNKVESYLRLNCKLTVAIPEVMRLTKYLILKQNHSFTDLLSKQIHRLRAAGVVQRIYSNFYPKILNSCNQRKETVDPISLHVTYPIFYVIAFGCFISVCVVVLEIFFMLKKPKLTNPKIPTAIIHQRKPIQQEKPIMYRTFWIYQA